MSESQQANLSGQQALRQQVGDRFYADWKSNDHRARRLVSEFIGTSGLTFVLSGGAAILAGYGGVLSAWRYWRTDGYRLYRSADGCRCCGLMCCRLLVWHGWKLSGNFTTAWDVDAGSYL